MKVSIIMASYNHARYLPEAINSALEQTYPDLEIVIVDDCSKDNSHQVINEFQEKFPDKIKAIFHQTNSGGHGGSVKTGFENSSGEIIAFLDSDDVWHPDKLDRVVNAFSDQNILGVMHPLETIDGDGNILKSRSPKELLPSGNLARVIIDTGCAWYYPPTSGLAFRRSALEKILPIVLAMDPPTWFVAFMDGCLLPCTAFLGQVHAINTILGGYRDHGMNSHAIASKASPTKENIIRKLAALEKSNRSLNDFLECIGYPERVSLSRHLDYRRTRYFAQSKWDAQEVQAISRLIVNCTLYSPLERVKFLVRFLIKSITPHSLYSEIIS
jgi:glycosyltransferase involved in cell wall biosynthesis